MMKKRIYNIIIRHTSFLFYPPFFPAPLRGGACGTVVIGSILDLQSDGAGSKPAFRSIATYCAGIQYLRGEILPSLITHLSQIPSVARRLPSPPGYAATQLHETVAALHAKVIYHHIIRSRMRLCALSSPWNG